MRASCTFLLAVSLVSLVAFAIGKDLTLTILHTNDVHSRFLQTNKHSSKCLPKEAQENKCYGGFARLHQKVKEIRREVPNVVYLSGGDYFQGTIWYTMYKWRIVAEYVNILNHTAMALGNHEFDDGILGLVPFLNAVTFPILSTNIDATNVPEMQGKFSKSLVVNYEGVPVGIIGYTTVETKAISSPGDLLFKDEIQAITEEAQRLDRIGVKILIAVGHAGFDVDIQIAKNVPLIDVVVGGHTNTFLYNGTAPDLEVPLETYPFIVSQEGGKNVPVVQAYAFGKYLGYLNITFDGNGNLQSWAGNPILLDSKIREDPEIVASLTKYSKNMTEAMKEEVGKTYVFLNGTSTECRLRECNLGNVVADAMIFSNLKYHGGNLWANVTMAFINGGGIRTSIDEIETKGIITAEDVYTVLPFSDTMDVVEIKGKHVKEAFEFSVAGYDPAGYHTAGKFLQVSGIRVLYDLSQPINSRVKKLEVLCTQCRVPSYVPIKPEEIYKVVVATYIAYGGDGFEVLRKNIIHSYKNEILGPDMLIEYIKARSPIIQGIEGRIQFYQNPKTGASSHSQRTTSCSAAAVAYLLLSICICKYWRFQSLM